MIAAARIAATAIFVTIGSSVPSVAGRSTTHTAFTSYTQPLSPSIFSRPGPDVRSTTTTRSLTRTNLYRKFHDYGWSKLLPDDGDTQLDTVPDELKSNTSPVKGAPPGTNVVANIRSISQFPSLAKSSSKDNNHAVLRLARSAFLETQTPTNEALITPMTIQVLNFVLFPSPHIQDGKSGEYIGVPILGADIVSLPGNKHLVALDFQPVLALNGSEDGSEESDNTNNEHGNSLFPKQYSHLEKKLEEIHAKYQKSASDDAEPLLAWGGDIPPQAKRFFSPYALWTRLTDDNAMDTVSSVVYQAYQEYTDLYLELISAVQNDVNAGKLVLGGTTVEGDSSSTNPVWKGQIDYLEYRRTNDPARPMLQRLYGEDWSESVIGGVLFPDL